MNKPELVSAVAVKAKITKKSAAAAVDALFETITMSLKKGDKVQIVGFGTLEVRSRNARKGHDPRTGEEIKIAASKSPVFKSGKSLKDAVNK